MQINFISVIIFKTPYKTIEIMFSSDRFNMTGMVTQFILMPGGKFQ